MVLLRENGIRVVPNPYVATNRFEEQNTFTTGRGPRVIRFVNLPPQCTLRIFSVNGRQVRELRLHEGANGSAGQMLQLRPSFEGSYESPTLRLLGLYSFDMQRSNFSSLNTPDSEVSAGGLVPGSPAEDAPLAQDGEPCWLLNQLSTAGLTPTISATSAIRVSQRPRSAMAVAVAPKMSTRRLSVIFGRGLTSFIMPHQVTPGNLNRRSILL